MVKIVNKQSLLITLLVCAGLSFIVLGQQQYSVSAQPLITDTPLPVVIPENTAQPTSMTLLTATPTFTMTPDQPEVVLQAAAPAGDINVRDYPDVTGTYLGSLQPEQQYPITGVYFQWYQFQYEASPTGLAWVFGDLVEVIGDQTAITPVDPDAQPTAESPEEIGTATAEALLLTPENAASATGAARVLTLPPEEESSVDGFPPTFTPPPDVAALEPTVVPESLTTTPQSPNLASQVLTQFSNTFPPIIPILALVGVGGLGLLIAIARR